jgi:hypothetical protein
MGLLDRILPSRRARGFADEAFSILREIVRGAHTLADARAELIRRAQKGDLDQALIRARSSESVARAFVDEGKVP